VVAFFIWNKATTNNKPCGFLFLFKNILFHLGDRLIAIHVSNALSFVILDMYECTRLKVIIFVSTDLQWVATLGWYQHWCTSTR